MNFGHTIGHAIEAWSGYERRHGECVSLGMVAACGLSTRLGLLGEDSAATIVDTLREFGLPVSVEVKLPTEIILNYIARDKKAAGDRVRLVLLDGIGRTVLRDDVGEELIAQVIDSLSAP